MTSFLTSKNLLVRLSIDLPYSTEFVSCFNNDKSSSIPLTLRCNSENLESSGFTLASICLFNPFRYDLSCFDISTSGLNRDCFSISWFLRSNLSVSELRLLTPLITAFNDDASFVLSPEFKRRFMRYSAEVSLLFNPKKSESFVVSPIKSLYAFVLNFLPL